MSEPFFSSPRFCHPISGKTMPYTSCAIVMCRLPAANTSSELRLSVWKPKTKITIMREPLACLPKRRWITSTATFDNFHHHLQSCSVVIGSCAAYYKITNMAYGHVHFKASSLDSVYYLLTYGSELRV